MGMFRWRPTTCILACRSGSICRGTSIRFRPIALPSPRVNNSRPFKAYRRARCTTIPVALSANQFGHQGAQPVVTANGTKGGIMWTIERIPGNGNGGVLHAYDATNIGNELYNSTQANSRDLFGEATKFSVPTIVNGKVYIGTQNSLAIFGLLQ